MFVRYKTNEKGKSVPVCKIYTSKEHPVRNSMIDRDALWAIRKIQQNGGEAYIVGGSIRDILLGNIPKDYDIGTSLSPRQVQKLFWNSRIIGRRFRIVHLFFGSKIIEVTTFRSDEENFEDGNNNIYGTIEQDARRRDFSINALYYNPRTCELLDFENSMADFEKKRIRSLIPLSYSFSEDPVRMIRAVKYKVTTGFRFCLNVAFAIRRDAPNLQNCATSRLTEEIVKILSSGHSKDIIHELYRYGLLQYILPSYAVHSELPSMMKSLEELDGIVMSARKENKSLPDRDLMFYYMTRSAIIVDKSHLIPWSDQMKDAFRQAKVMLSPITPSNSDLEKAVALVLEFNGLRRKKKKKAKTEENAVTSLPVNPKVKKRAPRKHRRKKKSSDIPAESTSAAESLPESAAVSS